MSSVICFTQLGVPCSVLTLALHAVNISCPKVLAFSAAATVQHAQECLLQSYPTVKMCMQCGMSFGPLFLENEKDNMWDHNADVLEHHDKFSISSFFTLVVGNTHHPTSGVCSLLPVCLVAQTKLACGTRNMEWMLY